MVRNALHLHPVELLLEDVKRYAGDVLFYDAASWPLGWLDDQLDAHRRAGTEGLEQLAYALTDLREMRRLAAEYNTGRVGGMCAGRDEAVRIARIMRHGNRYSPRLHHIRWARSKGFTVEPHPAWEGGYLLLRHPEHGAECTVDVSREVYELALIDALVAEAGASGSTPALDAVRALLGRLEGAQRFEKHMGDIHDVPLREPLPDEVQVVSAFWFSVVLVGAAFRAEQVAAEQVERGRELDAQTFKGLARSARVLSEIAKVWGDDDVELRRLPAQVTP